MKKRDLLFCLSLACMLPLHIYGARPIDTQAQLDRAREQQLAREARLGEGRITVQTGGLDITSGFLSSQLVKLMFTKNNAQSINKQDCLK